MDWTAGMRQAMSYFEVDRETWCDLQPIRTVVSGRIVRDMSLDTLEQATFEVAGEEMGESWVRCYLDAEQGEERVRECLGTFLVQTPRRSDDGRVSVLECTAYSPLHVLAEAKPDYGYSLAAGSDALGAAADICSQHGIAPVVAPDTLALLEGHYVAPSDSSWLSIASTLCAAANMHLELDAFGRIVIAPTIPTYMMLPSWTFRDDEHSIICPDVSEDKDWYGLPNVCVVVTPSGITGRAVNDDPASMLSTVSRGREVTLRVEDPDELKSNCTQSTADMLALLKLREASCMEESMSISHGYCPVRSGDMVRVDAPSMSLVADARVTRQEIELGTAVKVNATATVKKELWNG